MNLNIPEQPQTVAEFQNAFGDELDNSGWPEHLNGDGVISKLIGTKKSRAVVAEKLKKASPITAVKEVASKVVGTKESRAVVAGKVKSAVKTVGMAPSRSAFLGILAINGFGLATDLKKEKDGKTAKWKTIRDTKWAKWGGNRTELDKTVDNGSKRKALKLSFKKGADGTEETYFNVAGETVALITASVPLLVAVFAAIGKKPDENVDAKTLTDLDTEAKSQAATTEAAQKEQDVINATTPESEVSDSESPLKMWLWIGGGLVVAALAGFFIYRAAKK